MSSTSGGLTGSHLLAAQDQHLLIVASSADGTLVALNAESGALAWRRTTSACPSFWSLTNGTIYGLTGKALSAWSAASGDLLWSNAHEQPNGYPQALLVAEGKVYLRLFRNQVDVLNTSTRALLSSLHLAHSNATFDLATNGETLYVLGDASLAATAWRMTLVSGKRSWEATRTAR